MAGRHLQLRSQLFMFCFPRLTLSSNKPPQKLVNFWMGKSKWNISRIIGSTLNHFSKHFPTYHRCLDPPQGIVLGVQTPTHKIFGRLGEGVPFIWGWKGMPVCSPGVFVILGISTRCGCCRTWCGYTWHTGGDEMKTVWLHAWHTWRSIPFCKFLVTMVSKSLK